MANNRQYRFTVSLSAAGAEGLVHIVNIRAADVPTARSQVEASHPGCIVHEIRRTKASEPDTYPDARFIRGEFLSATFADEALLLSLTK
jgi:hypothetical protein